MKKIYHIEYDHTAGANSLYVETPPELSAAIDRLIDDPHVIQSSIVVWTETLAF